MKSSTNAKNFIIVQCNRSTMHIYIEVFLQNDLDLQTLYIIKCFFCYLRPFSTTSRLTSLLKLKKKFFSRKWQKPGGFTHVCLSREKKKFIDSSVSINVHWKAKDGANSKRLYLLSVLYKRDLITCAKKRKILVSVIFHQNIHIGITSIPSQ